MNNTTLHYVLLIAITFAIATILTLIFRKLLDTFIKKYSNRLQTNPTNFSFLKNSVGIVVYTGAIIFIFYKIPFLNSLGTALFAGAGVLAVAVGFASQNAFSNIVSGLFILIFKPFRVNDIVGFQTGMRGTVEEITLRHTIIRDFENRRIIIPNNKISEETITNSSIQDEKICKHIVFGISYDSNVDKAMNIVREEALAHPNCIDNRTPEDKKENLPVVATRVVGLRDFSVEIKAWVWTESNGLAFELECDLLKSVKARFDAEGIEIPFPYRTLVYKKDLEPNETPES